jgi:hypothetical protein
VGHTTIYLLPEEAVDPATYASRVLSVLTRWGVITEDHYDGQPTWYCAGHNSCTPFLEADEDFGFEYCIITGTSHVEVVPQDPAVQPRCPFCLGDLSDIYYEAINDIEDEYDGAEKSKQYLDARLGCSTCSHQSSLTELKDDVGIFLSGTWINFEDVESELRPEWVEQFNRETGWRHRVLTYWYT